MTRKIEAWYVVPGMNSDELFHDGGFKNEQGQAVIMVYTTVQRVDLFAVSRCLKRGMVL